MKIKAIRGFIYDKKTVERDDIVEVTDSFGAWAIAKGKATKAEKNKKNNGNN